MKKTILISVMLNFALLGTSLFLLLDRQPRATAAPPSAAESKPLAQALAAPAPESQPPSEMPARPFRWSDLESSNGYSSFIASLRAAGCPEPTIADIVRGDMDRAFAWERRQLDLDGDGNGSWSQAREGQLIASLLGGQPVESAASAGETENPAGMNSQGTARAQVTSSGAQTAPSAPLFLQNINWSALGLTPVQPAAIAQFRQQFQNQTANLDPSSTDQANQNSGTGNGDVSSGPSGVAQNPGSGDSAAPPKWQNTVQEANNELSGLLGAQAYEVYEQEQYLEWYTPQVKAAAAGGAPLIIMPDDFHPVR